MATRSSAEIERDEALRLLRATREAEKRATVAYRAASDRWMAATCGHANPGVGWCTLAKQHGGRHENLGGDWWL